MTPCPPLLTEALPVFADELRQLLSIDEPALAAQVDGMRIVDRCRCDDTFCGTFYVQPRPQGAFGAQHRNVVLDAREGMIILDVVADRVACVEVLYRNEVRQAIRKILP